MMLTLSILSSFTDPAATLDPVYSSPVYKELKDHMMSCEHGYLVITSTA